MTSLVAETKDRTDLWHITTKWNATIKSSSEESDNQPINPPSTLADITPREVPVLGESQQVIYKDQNDKEYLTPNGHFFADPAIRRVPMLTLQITQYESSVTYEQLLDRLLHVNSGTYRTYAAYKWCITKIEPVEVEVTLVSGPVTAAMVTYTITLDPRQYGWRDDRLLIDTHYKDGSGNLQPFMDGPLRTKRLGFVTSTGQKTASDTTREYDQWEPFPEVDFSTFMQV